MSDEISYVSPVGLVCANDLEAVARTPVKYSDNAITLAVSDESLVHVDKAGNLWHGCVVLQDEFS